MMTEQLSDIVARAHLRATQTQIMFMTNEAAEKRRDFSSFMITVLNDERKQGETTEDAAARANIPPPIDISGIIDRLQSRVPLRNEHEAMDSDDDDGVRYPFATHQLQEEQRYQQQQEWMRDEEQSLEDAQYVFHVEL